MVRVTYTVPMRARVHLRIGPVTLTPERRRGPRKPGNWVSLVAFLLLAAYILWIVLA